MLVLLMNYFSSQLFEIVRRFFDKEHFYKQHKAKIGNNKKRKKEKQEISNNLAQNFCYLKIIHFLHQDMVTSALDMKCVTCNKQRLNNMRS